MRIPNGNQRYPIIYLIFDALLIVNTTRFFSQYNIDLQFIFLISVAISGKNVFYMSDFRFNEFPNAPAHALYVTCVELLSLPVSPTVVANNIIDAIVKGYTVIPQNELHGWINVVGLLLTALPKCYWSVIYDRLKEVLKSEKMTEWPYRFSPFEMLNFKTATEAMIERKYVLLLAVAHSILHHSSIGQMVTIVE